MLRQSQKNSLDSFQVHPQYADIETRANNFTTSIHELNNLNITDKNILTLYESDARSEVEPTISNVAILYEQAGVVFNESVRKRFDEVESFHRQLTSNRKQFLISEIERLRRQIDERTTLIRDMTAQRAELLAVLETHRSSYRIHSAPTASYCRS